MEMGLVQNSKRKIQNCNSKFKIGKISDSLLVVAGARWRGMDISF
jgi:hypothetical protein